MYIFHQVLKDNHKVFDWGGFQKTASNRVKEIEDSETSINMHFATQLLYELSEKL